MCNYLLIIQYELRGRICSHIHGIIIDCVYYDVCNETVTEIIIVVERIRHKRRLLIYIYNYRRVCVCVSVCVSFQAYTRRHLWSNRNQIWHTHADSPRKGSGQNKKLPRVT